MTLARTLASDLSAVFSTADFAIEAESEAVGRIVGIFDEGDFETELEYGREVIRSQAVFTTRESYEIPEGDTLEICGKSYRVRYAMNDGTGVSRLYLERT